MITRASRSELKRHEFSSSSHSQPFNDSIQAFCHGEPVSMYSEVALLDDPLHAGKPPCFPRRSAPHNSNSNAKVTKIIEQLTQELASATTAVFVLGPDTVSALLTTIGSLSDY